MRADYSIEEMLLQSANMVVYRARGRNGFRYSVARLLFSQAVLNQAEAERLIGNGQSLIEALGHRSGALSFRARDVVRTTGRDGQPLDTCNIDLQRWFLDWALGQPPRLGRNPEDDLNRLSEVGLSKDAEPQIPPQHEPVVLRPIITQELSPAAADQPAPLNERKLLFQEPRWGRLSVR